MSFKRDKFAKDEIEAPTSNNVNNEHWGTRSWFEARFADYGASPASYYGHTLNGYQRYRHTKILNVLSDSLRLFQGGMILDIGCALGDLGKQVGDLCPSASVVGIDFVPAVVQQAAILHPSHTFAVAALPHMPFKEFAFDLVLASEVLYYLSNEDRQRALAQICRLIKPGGKLLFTSVLDKGTKYFSRSGAIDFIASCLEIEQIVYDYNRAYHWLNKQFMRTLTLRNWFYGKSQLPTKKYAFLWSTLSWIAETPLLKSVAGLMLKVLEYFALFLLSFKWLPAAMSYGSRRLWGDKAITNIVIIGKKYEE